ncbi:MAG: hypothetical protein HYZ74_08985 [Elusimicrobia bacterium]|nr:hypothetical protein [Elusimicrobiota bacterium]
MKTSARSLALALAASLLASAAHAGGLLPEGSFGGSSPLLKGPDVMALLVKKDRVNPTAYYVILAEYTRLPYIPGPERLEIARWVPRLYVYRAEQNGKLSLALKPLRVSAAGEIVADEGYATPGILTLAKKGTLDGAVLTRYEKKSPTIAETVTFQGKVSSTWEDYVPGDYFGSKDSTGGDYTRKDVNTRLSKDKVADFFQKDIVGKFDVAEKAPGLYTFKPKSAAVTGGDKVVTRIGAFVDIVNWKPFMTTDELLLINPDDAKDVGFYYERH